LISEVQEFNVPGHEVRRKEKGVEWLLQKLEQYAECTLEFNFIIDHSVARKIGKSREKASRR
jgi:hypothetical protein